MAKETKETVYRRIRKKQEDKPSIDDIAERTCIPKDTLGDIERGSKEPNPNDVVELSRTYNSKRLCRWYCSNKCPVGKEINLIKVKGLAEEDLGLTMLTIIDSLNKLNSIDLQRMIEISKDGIIDETEAEDFNTLKRNLKQISKAYGCLMRWEEDGNIIGVPLSELEDEDEDEEDEL